MNTKPTRKEIVAVAKAMWDCGVGNDERPAWDDLDDRFDAGLKTEFIDLAHAGLLVFLKMRSGQ